MKLLVTGGAGFIGSHFIRTILKKPGYYSVVNLDKLTYAGHLDNLREFNGRRDYRFVRGDIASVELVQRLMPGVEAVVNFAAETHVDRSIENSAPFLQTNIIGTQVLLDAARKAKVRRFLHISTDEVYGSITGAAATERFPLQPSSPYAASKASADLLVQSYLTTFGLPILITRAANNYGPFQYPEKFLPLFITRAMADEPLPLYGDGKNVRDWLHVDDHCRAIELVLRKGKIGEIYNIGSGKGYSNIAVVKRLLNLMEKPSSLVRFVTDRRGHDHRYAMSYAKIQSQLGWRPRIDFEEGLVQLLTWYTENRSWWEKITQKSKVFQSYSAKQYGARLARGAKSRLPG